MVPLDWNEVVDRRNKIQNTGGKGVFKPEEGMNISSKKKTEENIEGAKIDREGDHWKFWQEDGG